MRKRKTPYTKPMPLHNYWVQKEYINNGEQFLERITEEKANRFQALGYKVRKGLDQTAKFARELSGKKYRKPKEPMPEPMFDMDRLKTK